MGDLFEGIDPPQPQVKRKRGRPKKETPLLPEYELTDISGYTHQEIVTKLRNQIFTQAMLPSPQSTILVLAAKVFSIDTTSENTLTEAEQMTTDEIINRINKLIPQQRKEG
jgi:hypothetical protein